MKKNSNFTKLMQKCVHNHVPLRDVINLIVSHSNTKEYKSGNIIVPLRNDSDFGISDLDISFNIGVITSTNMKTALYAFDEEFLEQRVVTIDMNEEFWTNDIRYFRLKLDEDFLEKKNAKLDKIYPPKQNTYEMAIYKFDALMQKTAKTKSELKYLKELSKQNEITVIKNDLENNEIDRKTFYKNCKIIAKYCESAFKQRLEKYHETKNCKK